MKNFILLACFFTLMTCSRENNDNNCRFLLNLGVNVTVNMNLPQYSQLQFPNNPVYIANQGNGGIYVNNVGSSFRAFDASDPNHTPNSCSTLSLNGLEGVCGCADANT